jgi:hypothetical protein
MFSNLLPSVKFTPLYQEVLEVVRTHGKTKEIPLEFVSDRVKSTKHSSRVRLALDALVEKRLVLSSGGGYRFNPSTQPVAVILS